MATHGIALEIHADGSYTLREPVSAALWILRKFRVAPSAHGNDDAKRAELRKSTGDGSVAHLVNSDPYESEPRQGGAVKLSFPETSEQRSLLPASTHQMRAGHSDDLQLKL